MSTPDDASSDAAAPDGATVAHFTAPVTLRVNGVDHHVPDAWLGESLLHVLRERLGLPGAKGACEQGECGSCTVLVDDRALCSCLVLAAAAGGREIVTVEGITRAPGAAGDATAAGAAAAAADVQAAFVRAGGVQCGYCTPGLVVAVHELLARGAAPSPMAVREALSGNICRCTGYGRILDAVAMVVHERGQR